MKRKILLSAIVIGVVGVLIGTGVFAYLEDTEASTDNTFTAGTLNLKVGSADPCTEVITVSYPDDGENGSYDWLLKNDGSTAGYLDVTFANIVDAENGVNEPEDAAASEDGTVASPGTNGELADVLSLTIYIDENNDNDYDDPGDTLIYQGFVTPGLAGEQLSDYAMAANYGSAGTKAVRIEWSINGASVCSEIQSDSAGFDVNFELLATAD